MNAEPATVSSARRGLTSDPSESGRGSGGSSAAGGAAFRRGCGRRCGPVPLPALASIGPVGGGATDAAGGAKVTRGDSAGGGANMGPSGGRPHDGICCPCRGHCCG